jgi:glutathione S-transferase
MNTPDSATSTAAPSASSKAASASPKPTVTLYGTPISRTFRCLWMAHEFGLDFQFVPLDFRKGETRTPAHLARNPNGHVPVLEDGDVTLWESLAINLYLAKKHGGPLAPATVAEDGAITMWALWAANEVERPVVQVLLHRVFMPPERRDESKVAQALQDLAAPLGVLEAALAQSPWLVGARCTVADINTASIIDWLAAPEAFATRPALSDWFARCKARPAYAAAKAMQANPGVLRRMKPDA